MNRQKIQTALPILYKGYLWLLHGPVQRALLTGAFLSDFNRYRRYSYRRSRSGNSEKNLGALLLKYSHTIEKGFSMPEIRPGYGQAVIHELLTQVRRYEDRGFDRSNVAFRKAQSVLAEYLRYHDALGHDLGPIRKEIEPWVDMECSIGGYRELAAEALTRERTGDFASLAMSRSSVRNYTDEPVPREWILEAVAIAGKTPSACNRQCWHTYIVRDPELKAQVLALQNGNRGFGHRADFVAVVTADMSGFAGAGERYGAYIDGGMFAMSLLYALHYKGIGACPLNWMVPPVIDRRLKKLLNLSPSENTIMLIAGGRMPETVRVAKSVRKSVDDQLTFL